METFLLLSHAPLTSPPLTSPPLTVQQRPSDSAPRSRLRTFRLSRVRRDDSQPISLWCPADLFGQDDAMDKGRAGGVQVTASWQSGHHLARARLHVEATGHGTLLHQLGQTWPSFVAYVVSFFVIGVIWVNHHALFTLIDRVDRVLLFEELVLLMFVTTLPFTTSTLADFISEVAATHAGRSCCTASQHRHGVQLHRHAEPDRPSRAPGAPGPARCREPGHPTVRVGHDHLPPPATVLGLLWPPLILIAMGGRRRLLHAEQTPDPAEPRVDHGSNARIVQWTVTGGGCRCPDGPPGRIRAGEPAGRAGQAADHRQLGLRPPYPPREAASSMTFMPSSWDRMWQCHTDLPRSCTGPPRP